MKTKTLQNNVGMKTKTPQNNVRIMKNTTTQCRNNEKHHKTM
jgi:hypothetical protein